MKKILKWVALIFAVILISITGYYVQALIKARNYAENTIAADLFLSQWREFKGPTHEFEITAGDLTPRQLTILIMVQDPGFYNHNGVDLSTPGAGLTTITQAIVKKLFFKDFKPGVSKIRQTLIARFVADSLMSKEDQITIFINSMYFGTVDGRPAIGLEAAANAYYGRPVRMLNEDQYISLIAMIVMPSTFHIIDHPEWNRERVNRIKDLVAGRYQPKGLMDQFYGDLPSDVVNAGLPPASYFSDTKKE